MKRFNERSRATLRKEKDALETERTKRIQLEREVLPTKKERFESIQREWQEAETTEILLEKELEIGRKNLAGVRQRLEQQQRQLSKARGRLDQGHRQRDSNQARKLLQVGARPFLYCG